MIEPTDGTDSQKIRSLLEQLHAELGAHPPTDERSRELLRELQLDIDRATRLEADPAEPPHPSSLRERLQESIAGYEGTHPQTAVALERVLVLLSNFGL